MSRIQLIGLSLLLGLSVGFLGNSLVSTDESEGDNVKRGQSTSAVPFEAPDKDARIFLKQIPRSWPSNVPLPKYSRPKWAVATRSEAWVCFTQVFPVGVPLNAPRLIPFFTDQLSRRGYEIRSVDRVPGSYGGPATKLSFHSANLEWTGVITTGDVALGGIPCSFSVEVQRSFLHPS
jgi:hypothetical protein